MKPLSELRATSIIRSPDQTIRVPDLGLRKPCPSGRKYNGAQQIAYSAVILMGARSLLTGFAIYKQSQGHLLTTVLGGYETDRLCLGVLSLISDPRSRCARLCAASSQ